MAEGKKVPDDLARRTPSLTRQPTVPLADRASPSL
jgi:hypothetical protein